MPRTYSFEERREERAQICDASKKGDVEVVKALIKKGVQFDNHYSRHKWHRWFDDGETPLMLAAANGHLELTEFLLDSNVHVEYMDHYYKTALSYAADGNHLDVVNLLLRHGATSKVGDVLHQAIEDSNLEMARLVLDHRPDEIKYSGNLRYAVSKDDLPMVRLLLDRGADVESINCNTTDKETALFVAIRECHTTEIAELLLDRGAHVDAQDKDGKTPLFKAILNSVEEVQLLLDHGANMEHQDHSGQTPLFRYAESNDDCCDSIATLLLDRGANMEHKDNKGRTPLVVALRRHPAAVQLLLDRGANIESEDNDGRTPIFYVIENFWREHMDRLDLIVSRGANLEHQENNMGWTPLLFAVAKSNDSVDVTQCLVSGERWLPRRSNIDHRDNDGRTALSLASSYGYVDNVRLLLKHGADVGLCDNDGKTPLDHALAATVTVPDDNNNDENNGHNMQEQKQQQQMQVGIVYMLVQASVQQGYVGRMIFSGSNMKRTRDEATDMGEEMRPRM